MRRRGEEELVVKMRNEEERNEWIVKMRNEEERNGK